MAGSGVNQERFTKSKFMESLDAGLDNAPVTAAVQGAAVKVTGYESVTPYLHAGIQGGSASPATTFKIEESEDGSTGWVAAPDRDVLGFTNSTGLVITTANDETVHKAGYIGTKQHIRWVVSAVAGTTPSLPCVGGVMLSDARREPVA